MSVPTLEKTWQTSFNLSNTPAGTDEVDLDNVDVLIKNALVGFSTNPWVVIGSSNGSAASMDGTDRITNAAAIVHANAGSAHSWWVLKDNVTGVSACWDRNNTDVRTGTIAWSPAAGFTGGSTTARPTATDEQVIFNASFTYGAPGGSGAQFRAHVWRATDGTCTRVMVCGNNVVVGAWFFEKLSAFATGWTGLCAAAVSIGASFSDTTLLNAVNWLDGVQTFKAKGTAAATMPLEMTAESTRLTAITRRFNGANEISSQWPIIPIGAWHDTTVGQRGRHGYFADLFFTCAGPLTGDTFPETGTHLFQVMGDMVVTTGGTTLLLG